MEHSIGVTALTCLISRATSVLAGYGAKCLVGFFPPLLLAVNL
ncbi:hypothetical protein ACFT7S_13290 [Streptomyces sp. NPDC057136]